MKIKKHYYCLMDSNNKPDFRYLFTNKIDAEKKRKEIKNSTIGETLFVSKNKRDFFVDGVQKNLIGQNKLVNIKKGCWVTLKTKQLFILDTIKPEVYFQNVIHNTEETVVHYVSAPQTTLAKANNQSFALSPSPKVTTSKSKIITKKQSLKSQKTFSNHFYDSKTVEIKPRKKTFNLLIPKESFAILRTKMFAFNFAIILLLCTASIIYFNNKSQQKLATAIASTQEKITKEIPTPASEKVAVLGAMQEKDNKITNADLDQTVFKTLQEFDKIKTEKMEEKINQMVAGTPMEKMTPYIAKQDKTVAAFLVGIAKKESNYGRRVPVLNGKDCYNYWGYRGIRKRMGSGGHTCFDSPEDAIKTVGGRISRLVKSGVDTPQEMVLWKCGSDCNATGGWPAAHKWISDVSLYYSKMIDLTNEDDPSKDNQIDPDDDEKQVLSLQG